MSATYFPDGSTLLEALWPRDPTTAALPCCCALAVPVSDGPTGHPHRLRTGSADLAKRALTLYGYVLAPDPLGHGRPQE
jgi:hypothetical protein